MRTPDFERYVAACDYPGHLDETAVTRRLGEYLTALGVTDQVRRLPVDWNLATEEPLRRSVLRVLEDFARRRGGAAHDARDAHAAHAALDALAAHGARDARAALDALAAHAAHAAHAALDALAPPSRATAAAQALHRFASWCLHRSGGWWGWWELSWIVPTLLGAQQLGTQIAWAGPLFEAYIAGAWFLFWAEDTLYWVAKPIVRVEPWANPRGRRLHCADGPAVESDADNLYFWHGVLVPAFVVVRPEWITAQHVLQEENAEVRRVMVERMGHERFLNDSGATPVGHDHTGELFRIEQEGDEPLVLVRVVNSTPEPDGSRKRYVLRVPPDVKTAREAVAWTFGLTPTHYAPAIET